MSQKVNNPDNTIAFQGIPGAYSEMACLSNFNTMETLACPSFEQMISSVQDNKAKLAMVPVENSTAGRVADIHHLLPESGLFIIGETFFRVNHMLLGPKGSKLENLKEVRSHAQGLAQCRQNINNLNLIPVIHPDTAGAAKEVSELNDKFIGAIASNLAAKRYNLEILKSSGPIFSIGDNNPFNTKYLPENSLVSSIENKSEVDSTIHKRSLSLVLLEQILHISKSLITPQHWHGLIVSRAILIEFEINSAPCLFVLNKFNAILLAVFGPTPGKIFKASISDSMFSLIFIFY